VPKGSGNDFARALGLLRVRDSLAAWRRFCTRPDNVRTIALGLITPLESTDEAPASQATSPAVVHSARYFCCAAGVGLDGEVARRANKLPRWLRAHGGYALSLAPAIFRFAPQSIKIRSRADGADDQGRPVMGSDWTTRSDQPTVLAVFANTPVYGGGMKVAPRALMDDGQLDVCLLARINKLKLFCIFPSVYFGHHPSMAEVDYFQSAHVRVETEHPLDVYADGEYVCRTPVEVAVRRDVLRVIVHPSQTSFEFLVSSFR